MLGSGFHTLIFSTGGTVLGMSRIQPTKGLPDVATAILVIKPRRRDALDNLTPGVQQDSVGLGLGPEHAIAVVEVVAEGLSDLEAVAAVALVPLLGCGLVGPPALISLLGHGPVGSPVGFHQRTDIPHLPGRAAGVLLSRAQAIIRLWLQGNQ